MTARGFTVRLTMRVERWCFVTGTSEDSRASRQQGPQGRKGPNRGGTDTMDNGGATQGAQSVRGRLAASRYGCQWAAVRLRDMAARAENRGSFPVSCECAGPTVRDGQGQGMRRLEQKGSSGGCEHGARRTYNGRLTSTEAHGVRDRGSNERGGSRKGRRSKCADSRGP